MNCLPLFHIHGLAVNVLVPAIAGAMSVCLSGPFDAAAVLKRLNTEPQITLYSAVPTLHQLIFTAKSDNFLGKLATLLSALSHFVMIFEE